VPDLEVILVESGNYENIDYDIYIVMMPLPKNSKSQKSYYNSGLLLHWQPLKSVNYLNSPRKAQAVT